MPRRGQEMLAMGEAKRNPWISARTNLKPRQNMSPGWSNIHVVSDLWGKPKLPLHYGKLISQA